MLVLAAGIAIGADHPVGNVRAASSGKIPHPIEVLDRQDAGHDRRRDAGGGAGVAETEERLVLEEELRHARRSRRRRSCASGARRRRACRPPRDAAPDRRRPRSGTVPMRPSASTSSTELAKPSACARNPPASFGGSPRRATIRRQPSLAYAAGHVQNLAARGADAGQVAGDVQPRTVADGQDRRQRPVTGRAASAIGDGNEIGTERRQPLDGAPQGCAGRGRLGRKELETDLRKRTCAGSTDHSIILNGLLRAPRRIRVPASDVHVACRRSKATIQVRRATPAPKADRAAARCCENAPSALSATSALYHVASTRREVEIRL